MEKGVEGGESVSYGKNTELGGKAVGSDEEMMWWRRGRDCQRNTTEERAREVTCLLSHT